jgi:pimeloyl-ACP methyl ester carboxylesterase
MEPRARSLFTVLAAILAISLAACGAATAPSSTDEEATPSLGSSSPEPSAAPGARQAFEVDVGGLTIVGHCTGTRGEGEPAILLQHGNGGTRDHLAGIEAYLRRSALVCAYDRPGGSGRSEPPDQRPRSVTDIAEEAHAVLAAAGVEPPYFLIGQSAGAAISIVHAHLYPDDVAGFIASNPNPPFTAWIEAASEVETPEEIETLELPDYRGENPEGIDMRANDIMLERLPDSMPFAILFDEDCGGDTAFCDRIREPLAATQELLAGTGAGGRFIWVEGAGHEIPVTRPDVVQDTFDELWAEATEG